MIIDASEDAPALRCIDRCLWIYVDRDASKTPDAKIADFKSMIGKLSRKT